MKLSARLYERTDLVWHAGGKPRAAAKDRYLICMQGHAAEAYKLLGVIDMRYDIVSHIMQGHAADASLTVNGLVRWSQSVF